jgi:hypothetical protein
MYVTLISGAPPLSLRPCLDTQSLALGETDRKDVNRAAFLLCDNEDDGSCSKESAVQRAASFIDPWCKAAAMMHPERMMQDKLMAFP